LKELLGWAKENMPLSGYNSQAVGFHFCLSSLAKKKEKI
jgi:hypothetical protein